MAWASPALSFRDPMIPIDPFALGEDPGPLRRPASPVGMDDQTHRSAVQTSITNVNIPAK